MGYPLSFLVNPLGRGVHRCVSRCVRWEFLIDSPDRWARIVRRLDLLAGVFAIDRVNLAIRAGDPHDDDDNSIVELG